ncbi:MAG: putative RNA methyltransferase [Panacagrimonas sp.]
MSCIVCPACRLPLDRLTRVWTCARGHSFDVAREGYVNLLLAQHRNSREPGDKPDMVRARREFLHAGHYAPLREAVLDLLGPLGLGTLVDIGCGEGYYTSAFPSIAAEVIGLDISRAAVQLAAKRFSGSITWLVGSGAVLPVADASVDLVSSLFCPLHVREMQRVLKPGAHVLLVTPAADHLWSLREGLFKEVRAHEPDKFLAGFETDFELCGRQRLRVPLSLTQSGLKQLLLMTPYGWKARPERRAALELHESFVTQAAFDLMLFRRTDAAPARRVDKRSASTTPG